jgi:hypothetical protein
MTGLLLATLSLIAAYRAARARSIVMYLASGAFAAATIGFKQNYAIVALVPPLAVLFTTRRDLAMSLIPAASVVVAVVLLKVLWPDAYFYAIHVATLYSIPRARLVSGTIALITLNPFFLLLLAMLLAGGARRWARSRAGTWILASVLIGSAAGVISFAKHGGSYNSLMLAFAPMTALCILMLPRAIRWLCDRHTMLWTRLAMSVLLALALIVSTLAVPMSDRWAGAVGHGTDGYDKTIATAARIRGRVMCPDDPTIMLFARGQIDRALDAELDAIARPGFMPLYVARDIRQADYLIRVNSVFDNFNNETVMQVLGYKQVSKPAIGRGYTLWRRIVKADAPLPDEVSLIVRRKVAKDRP